MAKRKSIPKKVKEILREEVGFGCPVRDCGNPYLEYHHFDPPVHIKPHNDPKGMIALCAHHHNKADGRAYTNEQLHEFKKNRVHSKSVKGNLEWLRRDMLSVVGGNLYYETPIPVQIDGHNLVAFNRDSSGFQRLSVSMLSLLPEERLIIDENSWENIGHPIDLRSPPQGKELEVRYGNGDFLYLRFLEVLTDEQLKSKYKISDTSDFNFPITVVEINFSIGGTNIDFSDSGTQVFGMNVSSSVMVRCGVGFCIETGIQWQQNPKWKLEQRYDIQEENVIKVAFGK
ncbi:HNH endonuclease [Vibrio parahaemolyticus]|uniref:HNH endonuclease signature motif containing protein n=1 Tax=Vibrio harveyi group TaxID=717610 RepID=UPI00041E0138|nr:MULTISPECIES: HNH endonuclease signature motif containing protein [Vibrio harveyi group]EJM7155107.1 HNH endonuclease [Vibrio parahaemolyticus]ELS3714447.1 HNH endonuclease [Vibrio fluvialis]ELX9692102.1 HNH endonuclease [Vibrio fluvialis]MBS9913122.1 HNH endonuclease [Vibrio alginolyticus]